MTAIPSRGFKLGINLLIAPPAKQREKQGRNRGFLIHTEVLAPSTDSPQVSLPIPKDGQLGMVRVPRPVLNLPAELRWTGRALKSACSTGSHVAEAALDGYMQLTP
jgi:hypothetical protein